MRNLLLDDLDPRADFGKVVARCRVGGRDWNETAINAAVCGARGVPVALVT